jgi:predicted RNA-binding Zn-ribbon protein involved in translation (DUF1610 family)
MNGETYKLDVLCLNCDFFGELDIPKGQKTDFLICPKCGNNTLQRDFNADSRKARPISFR